MAVASGGGHWVQLLRLYPAFAHHDTTFVTVSNDYRSDVPAGCNLRVITDATRWDKLRLVAMSLQLMAAVVRIRPNVVISTGAAPGVIAFRLARLMRARTIWIDSIANCEELSMSGRRVGRGTDLWLTQWEHLATPDGPRYAGSVA
jgi:exopolysaccharide biosynthesis glucuronosyltransferase PssD